MTIKMATADTPEGLVEEIERIIMERNEAEMQLAGCGKAGRRPEIQYQAVAVEQQVGFGATGRLVLKARYTALLIWD